MPAELLGREIDAVVFDVDGTMYDHPNTKVIWGPARWNLAIYLLQVAGKAEPFTDAEIRSMQDRYVQQSKAINSFNDAFISLGGTLEDFFRIIDTVDRPKILSPNPKFQNLLSQMRNSSLQIGILSSSTEHSVESTCSALLGPAWKKNFDNIHCLNTPGVNWYKPQPEAFRHILVTLGVKPAKSFMVGDDRQNDLVPARSLDMLTVQVGKKDYPEAHLQINEVTDLIDHLKFS